MHKIFHCVATALMTAFFVASIMAIGAGSQEPLLWYNIGLSIVGLCAQFLHLGIEWYESTQRNIFGE